MSSASRSALASSSLWFFISLQVMNFGSFLYWLIIPRLIPVKILDLVVGLVSLSNVVLSCIFAPYNITVVRLVAEQREILPLLLLISFLISLSCGIILFFISYRLARVFYYAFLISVLALMAGLGGTFSAVAQGLLKVKFLAIAQLCAVIVKFVVTLILLFVGVNYVVCILAGYMSAPFTLIVMLALSKFIRCCLSSSISFEHVSRILRFFGSNIPPVAFRVVTVNVAPVLLSFLGYVVGDVSTIYLAITIMIALASIPGSVVAMSLPVSVTYREDVTVTAFRIGLGLATIIAVIVLACSRYVLYLIKPVLATRWTMFNIVISVLPLWVFSMLVVSRWNVYGRLRDLTIAGLLNLTTFTIVSILTYPHLSSISIPVALYLGLLAYTIYAVLRDVELRNLALIYSTTIVTIITVISIITNLNPIIMSILLTTTLITTHITKLLTIQDITTILKYLLNELKSIVRRSH